MIKFCIKYGTSKASMELQSILIKNLTSEDRYRRRYLQMLLYHKSNIIFVYKYMFKT